MGGGRVPQGEQEKPGGRRALGAGLGVAGVQMARITSFTSSRTFHISRSSVPGMYYLYDTKVLLRWKEIGVRAPEGRGSGAGASSGPGGALGDTLIRAAQGPASGDSLGPCFPGSGARCPDSPDLAGPLRPPWGPPTSPPPRGGPGRMPVTTLPPQGIALGTCFSISLFKFSNARTWHKTQIAPRCKE